MKTIAASFVLVMALVGSGTALRWPGQARGQGPGQTASQPPAVQQLPIMPVDATRRPVQITQGPVVEHVTDTTAEIAWSTNVNSGTSLRFGTDPSHLDQTASMPWGGLTHRVFIKNLQPNTTYYFKAESGEGQGTGTQAETGQSSFQTRPAGATSQIQ